MEILTLSWAAIVISAIGLAVSFTIATGVRSSPVKTTSDARVDHVIWRRSARYEATMFFVQLIIVVVSIRAVIHPRPGLEIETLFGRIAVSALITGQLIFDYLDVRRLAMIFKEMDAAKKDEASS